MIITVQIADRRLIGVRKNDRTSRIQRERDHGTDSEGVRGKLDLC